MDLNYYEYGRLRLRDLRRFVELIDSIIDFSLVE